MLDIFKRAVVCIYDDIGLPISIKAKNQLLDGDWVGLLTNSVNPADFSSSFEYLLAAQTCALLKKCAGLPTRIDTRAAAIKTWWAGEAQCKRTNDRLYPYTQNTLLPELREDGITQFLSDVKTIIRSWIGDFPPELVQGRFGPGSTFSDTGSPVLGDKISNKPTLTRDAVYHLPQFLGTWWGHTVAQNHGKINFVRGNRFATAPKTGLTDRSIGIEPSINAYFQLGYGRSLRNRLCLSTGVALKDSQSRHRDLARESSRSFKNCTIDLSNASDTLCTSLVKLVLPSHWHDALSAVRSPATLLNGKWVKLEKFSSMGNGYTFELETIIFAAIACAVVRKYGHAGEFGNDVHVYGDDIIVPDDCYSPLKSVLAFLGFSVNPSKSFHGTVPFRESCGGDYFNGVDVRPFYQKRIPDEPQEIIGFINGITRFLKTSGLVHRGRDCGRSVMLGILPSTIRCIRGPVSYGDLVIQDDDPTTWTVKSRDGIRRIRVFRPNRYRVVPFSGFAPDCVLAAALYGAPGSSIVGGFIPRDGILSYKLGWSALLE